MRLVVDANVIFSAIIRRQHTFHILENTHIELFAPEYLLEELRIHAALIREKAGISIQELDELVIAFRKRIAFIPDKEFVGELSLAFAISPDPKDTAYLALALSLNCPLWSNDKKLKEQKEVLVYSTREIIDILTKTNA